MFRLRGWTPVVADSDRSPSSDRDTSRSRLHASWLRAAADTLGTLQYTRRIGNDTIAATLPLGVISVVSIRFRPMPTIRADNLN